MKSVMSAPMTAMLRLFVSNFALVAAASGLVLVSVGCKTTSDNTSATESAPASAPASIDDGFKGRAPLRDEKLARMIYEFARQRLEVATGEMETHFEDFESFKFDVLSRKGNVMSVELSGKYRKTPDLYEDPEGAMTCYRFNAGLELVETDKQWNIPEEKPFGVANEASVDCI
jgi:hypothetical protein